MKDYYSQISEDNIQLARKNLKNITNCSLKVMNVTDLKFPDKSFDVVVCLQNGISAFHVDQIELIRESLRVTKPGGLILFSTYSSK